MHGGVCHLECARTCEILQHAVCEWDTPLGTCTSFKVSGAPVCHARSVGTSCERIHFEASFVQFDCKFSPCGENTQGQQSVFWCPRVAMVTYPRPPSLVHVGIRSHRAQQQHMLCNSKLRQIQLAPHRGSYAVEGSTRCQGGTENVRSSPSIYMPTPSAVPESVSATFVRRPHGTERSSTQACL